MEGKEEKQTGFCWAETVRLRAALDSDLGNERAEGFAQESWSPKAPGFVRICSGDDESVMGWDMMEDELKSSYSATLRQKSGFKLLELLWFISATTEALIYRQITSLCSRWLILSESH